MFETVAVANAKAVLHKKSTVRQKDIGMELKRMRDTNIEDDEPDDPLEAARQDAVVRLIFLVFIASLVVRAWLVTGYPFCYRRPRSMRTRGTWTLHCGNGRKLKQRSTARIGQLECRQNRNRIPNVELSTGQHFHDLWTIPRRA